MKALCAQHKACSNADIDVIGARVNGRNRPNGADDRLFLRTALTRRSSAFSSSSVPALGWGFTAFPSSRWFREFLDRHSCRCSPNYNSPLGLI